MRWLMPVLLTPMLAACGAGDPPSVDFERPVATVYNTLAAVDGRVDLQGLLTSPVVARSQTADDRLEFRLGPDSAAHRGRITFRFEALDAHRSRVTVDAELPEIAATIDGQSRVLSESKVEEMLANQLGALSRRMSGGGMPVAELDRLDQSIAFAALALDPSQVNRALALAGDGEALGAAMAHEAEWNADAPLEWDAAGSAMDDASGEPALGTEPLPDAGWGAPAR